MRLGRSAYRHIGIYEGIVLGEGFALFVGWEGVRRHFRINRRHSNSVTPLDSNFSPYWSEKWGYVRLSF